MCNKCNGSGINEENYDKWINGLRKDLTDQFEEETKTMKLISKRIYGGWKPFHQGAGDLTFYGLNDENVTEVNGVKYVTAENHDYKMEVIDKQHPEWNNTIINYIERYIEVLGWGDDVPNDCICECNIIY